MNEYRRVGTTVTHTLRQL